MTPAEVVDASYELISFPSGDEPAWTRFQELFVGSAILALRVFPSDPEVSVLSLEAYAQSQMQHNLSEEGYSETPGDRSTEIVGDVAIVRQEFTINYADRPPVAALDVFSLVRTSEGWRIVSIVSDVISDLIESPSR